MEGNSGKRQEAKGGEMPDALVAPATSVALVEDDSATRERLACSVRAQSSLKLVAEYSNGADALSGLASHAPDVLLVDLGLPDMSGLELIRFAAERYPDCDILVISIFGDEANVLAALEAGARGYLLKGSLQHDIAFDIRDIRNGGSPLSPVIARQMLKRLRMPVRQALAKKTGEEETMLTAREGEILNAISRGFSYAETAQMLGVSVGTVHSFLKRVYRKLAVHSKTEAVFEANRLGLIP
jgi:DNA-binding NarL/FixJ family response regulator